MKTTTVVSTETRTMQPSDLGQVMVIEDTNGPRSNPMGGAWTKEDFCAVLQAANHQGIVALMKQNRKYKIVGFAVYCLLADKIHVCNMAVHPEHQGQGVGTMLIDRLKDKLARSGRRKALEFDIRESNLPAQLYLKGRGFRAISVVRNWYEQPVREDAYKFQFKLEG